MKTLVAVGRTAGHAYTMEIIHTFPLSPEWFERNDAAVCQ